MQVVQSDVEKAFVHALKYAARNVIIKDTLQQSSELYPLLQRAAERYVTGESREDGTITGQQLAQRGYSISLEYIGENTLSQEECVRAKDEFLQLIRSCVTQGLQARICLDLSHLGLSFDPALAYSHLLEIAAAAQLFGMTVMVGMEDSSKTDTIVQIYQKAAAQFPNLGITLQAYLHRTAQDLEDLLGKAHLIRIVKGAFQEPDAIHLPRSSALNDRYIALVRRCMETGTPVSVATHDEKIFDELFAHEYIRQPQVEVEMLYGVRPELGSRLKNEGIPIRLYLTYGADWFLYLCHRIAEHPPNLYTAVTDLIHGAGSSVKSYS